jgi:hypothetical protein
MAGERKIHRNLAFYLDGHPISTGASKFEVKAGRERLPWKCYEDEGQFSDKGDWSASVALEGYGMEAEGKLLERLAEDAEDDTSFLLLLESNTKLTPHAQPGSAALFMMARTFGVDMPAEGGKIKQFASQHENGDGQRPFFGKTIFTNRGKTPDPLVAPDPLTPSPITLPALDEGTFGVFTVHCSKISGTGIVNLLCEVLSDTPGFGSPLVRFTFPLFTNEEPTPAGQVLGPKSQTVVIDGDATPFPGETQWTIRFTATDTDTDGQVEVTAAGVIVPKMT